MARDIKTDGKELKYLDELLISGHMQKRHVSHSSIHESTKKFNREQKEFNNSLVWHINNLVSKTNLVE